MESANHLSVMWHTSLWHESTLGIQYQATKCIRADRTKYYHANRSNRERLLWINFRPKCRFSRCRVSVLGKRNDAAPPATLPCSPTRSGWLFSAKNSRKLVPNGHEINEYDGITYVILGSETRPSILACNVLVMPCPGYGVRPRLPSTSDCMEWYTRIDWHVEVIYN